MGNPGGKSCLGGSLDSEATHETLLGTMGGSFLVVVGETNRVLLAWNMQHNVGLAWRKFARLYVIHDPRKEGLHQPFPIRLPGDYEFYGFFGPKLCQRFAGVYLHVESISRFPC